MFISDRTRPLIDTLVKATGFGSNDVDKASSTVTYEGSESPDGEWVILEVTVADTITSMRYATAKNNPSKTSYSTAWTDRASLTYDYYSVAF